MSFQLVAGIEVESLKSVILDNIDDNFDVLWLFLFSSKDRPHYLLLGDEKPEHIETYKYQYECEFDRKCIDNVELVKFIADGEYEDKVLICPIMITERATEYVALDIDEYKVSEEQHSELMSIAERLKLKEFKISRWLVVC